MKERIDWWDRTEAFRSTKFVLTFLCLTAVFGLTALGRNVSDLAILVPAILAFYIGGNVVQDVARSQIQAKQDVAQSRILSDSNTAQVEMGARYTAPPIETPAGSGP